MGKENPNLVSLSYEIAKYEGFYISESLAQRNNNPGNMEFHEIYKERYGASLGDGGRFCYFPMVGTGWIALKNLIREKYVNYTIFGMMCKYAPPRENATLQYAQQLADNLGISIDTRVRDYLDTGNIGKDKPLREGAGQKELRKVSGGIKIEADGTLSLEY